MNNWLFKLIIADQIYLLLLIISFGILVYKYSKLPYSLRLLTLYTGVNLLVEAGSDYLNYALDRENIYLYYLFAPVGYTILALFFYQNFRSIRWRRIIVISIPSYIVAVFFITFYWERLDRINSIAYLLESVLVVFWCFLFLQQLLQPTNSDYQPERDLIFWVVISILFCFLGNFFIIGLINYVIKYNINLAQKIYYTGYGFNYLLYTTIAFVCVFKSLFIIYRHGPTER